MVKNFDLESFIKGYVFVVCGRQSRLECYEDEVIAEVMDSILYIKNAPVIQTNEQLEVV